MAAVIATAIGDLIAVDITDPTITAIGPGGMAATIGKLLNKIDLRFFHIRTMEQTKKCRCVVVKTTTYAEAHVYDYIYDNNATIKIYEGRNMNAIYKKLFTEEADSRLDMYLEELEEYKNSFGDDEDGFADYSDYINPKYIFVRDTCKIPDDSCEGMAWYPIVIDMYARIPKEKRKVYMVRAISKNIKMMKDLILAEVVRTRCKQRWTEQIYIMEI